MEFLEILKQRYATKKFTDKIIDEDKIDKLLEMIRLAPTSLGMQPFKVIVVRNQKLKDKLLPASFNQEQVSTCSHLLVFAADTDVESHANEYFKVMESQNISENKISSFKDMIGNYLEMIPDKLTWAKLQSYIAMSNALNGAKSLGFDSCPIEGFNPAKYDEILELPENLKSCVVVPVGIAADVSREKVRLSKEFLFINKD